MDTYEIQMQHESLWIVHSSVLFMKILFLLCKAVEMFHENGCEVESVESAADILKCQLYSIKFLLYRPCWPVLT